MPHAFIKALPDVTATSSMMYRKYGLEQGGRCVERNALFVMNCHLLGWTDVIVQAGSCYWPRVPWTGAPVLDGDFGYEWKNTDETWERVRTGIMPEIHVWAASPNAGVIIDPSSQFMPEHCTIISNREWTAPRPPAWFTHNFSEQLPPGIVYRSDAAATMLSVHYVTKFLASITVSEKNMANGGYLFKMIEQARQFGDAVQANAGCDGCPYRHPNAKLFTERRVS